MPKIWVNEKIFIDGIGFTAEMVSLDSITVGEILAANMVKMIQQALDKSSLPGKYRVQVVDGR